MLLTITTTHRPATDLGYLLHKHPDRVQAFDLAFGKVHVFYPEAGEERCTAALLLDVDPIDLVRGKSRETGYAQPLEPYVNDRPYTVSSFMSVAIARVLGTALSGRCEAKPTLVATSIPLTATLAPVRSNGGEELIRCLFEPIGYTVTAGSQPLDARCSIP